MFLVGEVMVSDLVIETRFSCQLDLCRGMCCLEGQRGSPLRPSEEQAIRDDLPAIIPLMSPDRRRDITRRGFFTREEPDQVELRCLDDGRCIFATLPKANAPLNCVLELAWLRGVSTLRKPSFCHLFPLRLEDFYGRVCLNLERRDECRAGFDDGPLVVEFCRDALVTEFGAPWYEELHEAVLNERNRRRIL